MLFNYCVSLIYIFLKCILINYQIKKLTVYNTLYMYITVYLDFFLMILKFESAKPILLPLTVRYLHTDTFY